MRESSFTTSCVNENDGETPRCRGMVGQSMNFRLPSKSDSDLRIVSLLGALLLFCALALAACSNPPNTQLLPIGSRCTTDSECGTSPYICETTDTTSPTPISYPNGYCDKVCSTTGDCPADSLCYASHCRRTCAATSDCRQAEGYVCRMTAGAMNFCDVPEGN
jgi:hypothetical protein